MAKDAPKMTATQRFKLKKFIEELQQYRGRGTELVSVYVPQGYELSKIIGHLSDEQGTATNIKSTSTRKNVIDALERMIQHLKLIERTPPNGLVAFSGNVSEREGQSDVQVWSMEPPLPLNQRLYRCDKEFITEALEDMADDKNLYGMIVMDKREATIAQLKGKTIIPLVSTHSAVPGKTRAGGQCLAPETLVHMASGELKPIADIEPGMEVLSADHTGTLRPSKVTDVWTTKKQQKYTITTKNPRIQIECSKDHLFLQRQNTLSWSAADELQIGDSLVFPELVRVRGELHLLNSALKEFYVLDDKGRSVLREKRTTLGLSQKALASRINSRQSIISRYERGAADIPSTVFANLCETLHCPNLKNYATIRSPSDFPSVLSPAFAQILGYFLGDGYYDRTRIGFCEQREDLAKYYATVLQAAFGREFSMNYRQEKSYYDVRACIGQASERLQEEFPELGVGALGSRVPEKIMTSMRSVVAGFLRGLFDAEGYVTQHHVGIGMNNKQVIQSVQLLLLRFGIVSSVHRYDNRRNPYSDNTRYSVQFSEKTSLQIFQRSIDFTASDKQKLLAALIEKKSSTSYTRQVLTPGSMMRSEIEAAGFNLELFPKVSDFFRDQREMSKSAFSRSILQNMPTSQLRQVALQVLSDNLLPAKIAEIQVADVPTEFVDISVEAENFLANGLVVHNSAARFERLREGAAKDFYRKVGDYVKEQFYNQENLKGILLGGPGHTKEAFLEEAQMPENLKEKFLPSLDLSYTGEFGLQELLEKAQDLLAAEDVVEEKVLMQKFFGHLSKDTGLAGYGKEEVRRLINLGAVETLILSETIDNASIKEFEELANNMGTDVSIVSLETREGVQLKEIGGYAAILRYAVEF